MLKKKNIYISVYSNYGYFYPKNKYKFSNNFNLYSPNYYCKSFKIVA